MGGFRGANVVDDYTHKSTGTTKMGRLDQWRLSKCGRPERLHNACVSIYDTRHWGREAGHIMTSKRCVWLLGGLAMMFCFLLSLLSLAGRAGLGADVDGMLFI